MSISYMTLGENPEGQRPTVKTSRRWKDNIEYGVLEYRLDSYGSGESTARFSELSGNKHSVSIKKQGIYS